jgi:hypothetical protein
MMGAVNTSEISVSIYETTRLNIPEDCLFTTASARTRNLMTMYEMEET